MQANVLLEAIHDLYLRRRKISMHAGGCATGSDLWSMLKNNISMHASIACYDWIYVQEDKIKVKSVLCMHASVLLKPIYICIISLHMHTAYVDCVIKANKAKLTGLFAEGLYLLYGLRRRLLPVDERRCGRRFLGSSCLSWRGGSLMRVHVETNVPRGLLLKFLYGTLGKI